MSPAEVVLMMLINTGVAWVVGCLAANSRLGLLRARQAEMEAAVEHYWDRIRKRVRVEPYEVAPAPARVEPDPFAAIRSRHAELATEQIGVPYAGEGIRRSAGLPRGA